MLFRSQPASGIAVGVSRWRVFGVFGDALRGLRGLPAHTGGKCQSHSSSNGNAPANPMAWPGRGCLLLCRRNDDDLVAGTIGGNHYRANDVWKRCQRSRIVWVVVLCDVVGRSHTAPRSASNEQDNEDANSRGRVGNDFVGRHYHDHVFSVVIIQIRSEERRVGKEGRSRWSPDH